MELADIGVNVSGVPWASPDAAGLDPFIAACAVNPADTVLPISHSLRTTTSLGH